MKTTFRATLYAATAGVALLAATHASATPMVLVLQATDTTTGTPEPTVVLCDVGGSACTAAGTAYGVVPVINATPNSINAAAGTQGLLVFSSEVSTSIIGSGPIFNNKITTSALSVANTSTTDTYQLTASLVGFNFQGPDNTYSVTGNGEFDSSGGSIMQLNYYDDPSNDGIADAATLINSFTSTPAAPNLASYSYSVDSATLGNPDTGLYSMTETWNYTLLPGGSLQNRGQTEDKIYTPEPASMLLLGVGTLGIGLIRRRRR